MQRTIGGHETMPATPQRPSGLEITDLKADIEELTGLFDKANLFGFMDGSHLAYNPHDHTTGGALYMLQGASNYADDFDSMGSTLCKCEDISEGMERLATYNCDEIHGGVRLVVTNTDQDRQPLFSIVHGDGWGSGCHFAMDYNEAMATIDGIRLNEIEAGMNVGKLDALLASMNLQVKGSDQSMSATATLEGRYFISDESICEHSRENCLLYGDYEDMANALSSIAIRKDMFADNYIYNELERIAEKSDGRLLSDLDCGFAGVLNVPLGGHPAIKGHLDDVLRRWALDGREGAKDYKFKLFFHPELKTKGFTAFPGKVCALKVAATEDGSDFSLVWERCRDHRGRNVVVSDEYGRSVIGAREVMGFIHRLIDTETRCGAETLERLVPHGRGHELHCVAKPPKSFDLDSPIFIVDGRYNIVETTPRDQMHKWAELGASEGTAYDSAFLKEFWGQTKLCYFLTQEEAHEALASEYAMV